jgi:hypothetical protein
MPMPKKERRNRSRARASVNRSGRRSGTLERLPVPKADTDVRNRTISAPNIGAIDHFLGLRSIILNRNFT